MCCFNSAFSDNFGAFPIANFRVGLRNCSRGHTVMSDTALRTYNLDAVNSERATSFPACFALEKMMAAGWLRARCLEYMVSSLKIKDTSLTSNWYPSSSNWDTTDLCAAVTAEEPRPAPMHPVLGKITTATARSGSLVSWSLKIRHTSNVIAA